MPGRGGVRPAYSIGMTTTARRDETITASSFLFLLSRYSFIGIFIRRTWYVVLHFTQLPKARLLFIPGNLQKGREKGGRVGESARCEWRGKDSGGQGCQGVSLEVTVTIFFC